MNLDNQRLKEIQELKPEYKHLMLNAPTMSEAFEFKNKLTELENEEKEILKRCDVIV